MPPGNAKRMGLDGLMGYVVDRIALTGEYGEWEFFFLGIENWNSIKQCA